MLGAGESPVDWAESKGASFRYASGVVSKVPAARAKWNIVGRGLTVWSSRGPGYGALEVRVDGRVAATLDLRSDQEVSSQLVWASMNWET